MKVSSHLLPCCSKSPQQSSHLPLQGAVLLLPEQQIVSSSGGGQTLTQQQSITSNFFIFHLTAKVMASPCSFSAAASKALLRPSISAFSRPLLAKASSTTLEVQKLQQHVFVT